MAKLRSVVTLEEGEALAVPLKNGLYVACRVLSDTSNELSIRYKKKYKCRDAVQITCCNWYGAQPPKASQLKQLREILRLTHHAFKGQPLAGWISADLPRNVVSVGVVPPRASEARLGKNDSLGWDHLRYQAQEQWNWDQDRAAVIARDEAEQAEIDRRDAEWVAREKKLLASLTLEQLAKQRFLKDWEDPIPAVAIRKSRKLLRDTAKQLMELGDAPSTKERLSVLQACIEQFNALDAKYGFIHTVEREDICDAFDLLVHACGLKRRKNLADEWRDW